MNILGRASFCSGSHSSDFASKTGSSGQPGCNGRREENHDEAPLEGDRGRERILIIILKGMRANIFTGAVSEHHILYQTAGAGVND